MKITNPGVQDNSITTAKIVDGAVTPAKLNLNYDHNLLGVDTSCPGSSSTTVLSLTGGNTSNIFWAGVRVALTAGGTASQVTVTLEDSGTVKAEGIVTVPASSTVEVSFSALGFYNTGTLDLVVTPSVTVTANKGGNSVATGIERFEIGT